MSVTVADIKKQIETINTAGKEYLTEQGVIWAEDTTLQIVNALLDYDTEIEGAIDDSGVLEESSNLAGKVEQLIEKAEEMEYWCAHMSYKAAFDGWTGTRLPKKVNMEKINALTTFQRFAASAPNLESVDFYITGNNPTTYHTAFGWTTKLKRIKGCNTKTATNFYKMFSGSGIEVIEEPFDFSSATILQNPFESCYNLKEIRIVNETIHASISFGWSSLLSTESIQSIIDGLAIVTTAQTLTLNPAITLTDEQKATINTKGWTLAQ